MPSIASSRLAPPALVLAVAACLLFTACSVSTPRHGGSFVGANGRTAPDGTPIDGGTSELGTVADGTLADGTAVGGTGSTAAGRAAGGPGGAGTTAGGAAGAAGGAVGSTKAPGVTDQVVVVSVIAGFSGVLAPVVERAYDGLETWVDDVNRAGGIHGRRIEFRRVDHKETADGGVAACREALSNGSFVALVPEGVEANVTAVSCLDAAGMPTLYFSATIDPKWRVAFSDVPTSVHGGTALASYIANKLGGRKVGVIFVKQLAYEATADAFNKTARQVGIDVVGSEAVEPNQGSFTSQLVRLKNAGASVVLISATAEAIGILRDAKVMGWSPQFTGWGFAFDFVTAAGRDLFRGIKTVRTYATVDTPAYNAYAERMQANGRGRSRDTDTEGFLAYAHGLMLGELLSKAGAQPTWGTFVAGAETIKGYDNKILPPVTYGAGDHVGSEAVFPIECCNEDWTWRGVGHAVDRF